MALTSRNLEAEDAYDALAPAYDLLTGGYAYGRWLQALEELAISHGLTGHRLLDLACGTGESFRPLMARGYEVTASDVSGEMLARAREKAPEALVYQADMRELPVFGEFDLITCLDDALNYMLEEDELGAALRGIAANLAPDGLALWDLNTLAQYRGQFAQDRIVTDESTYIGWRADAEAAQVGAVVRIAIDVFTHAGDECWRRSTSVHRQRHWPRLSVERLCRRAGLELLDVRGQRLGALIDRELDELVHTKAIYVARPSERSDMIIGMP